ncbi:MAG: M20/M25/M40 family metallo-hydrolase [Hyphomicrobiaceae bacterium]|nr:M20/M25/M40 family metallo-hydrolase [Hyphomicrobiaceae bacterium]
MSRDEAIKRSRACYDDEGPEGYYTRLQDLVAVKTESQNPDRLDEHYDYTKNHISPALERLGYTAQVFDNPFEGCGPVMLAERIEDQSLPTLLCYGHGDVVLGMEGRWEQDRDPWKLTVDGDRVYGRGTADNKGQHLAHFVALESVLETRGKLGFNSKIVIEQGEENGSKGFREVIAANRDAFKADAFFSSDGPRAEITRPNISLGNRGCLNFNLVVDLREGGHHSGNWGGLLRSPSAILSNAISSIITPEGVIQIEAWRPKGIPQSVRDALKGIDRDAGENAPKIDDDYGEPGLSRAEKVSIWNSFEVLAMEIGSPDRPVNAVPPRARAWCQLRHVIETPQDTILPSLREHLDANGFHEVQIEDPPFENRGYFEPGRTDPDHGWAVWLKGAVEGVSGQSCAVQSCSGGSNVTGVIQSELGMPFAWLPMSYLACSQHAPNEHILRPLMGEGLDLITGVYWEMGEADGYRP